MYVYAHAGQKDMGEDVIDNLLSSSFWTDVELFKELLEPIDEAIKMSESDKSHLGLSLKSMGLNSLPFVSNGDYFPFSSWIPWTW